MTLLALDIGGSLGWAHLVPDDTIEHGSEDLTPNRFDGAGMRFVRLRRFLDKRHDQARITLLVFEEVRSHESTDKKTGRRRTNVHASHVYGGYIGAVMAWGEDHDVPYTSVPIGSWKKALTGQGNASKDLVAAHVKRLGFSVKNQDVSDAIGVLLFAEDQAKCQIST